MRGASVALMALAIAALPALGAGCASGTDEDAGTSGTVDSGPRRDSGPRDAGGGTDAGGGGADSGTPMPDAGGGGVECGGMTCEAFQYCDAGACRDYPACRGDGTCDLPGAVCHNRRCVPMDVDIDGDGYPAGEDCDETDPDRNPGEMEICNSTDDDCNDMVDDGDPSVLCEFYPGGGECLEGSCGCNPGTFDIDRSVPGCECVAEPVLDQALSCDTAIDLGNIADTGQVQTVVGNVMPDDREVWYRFRAVDSADTSCDNFHVRAQLTANPDDTFELTVFRGSCNTPACEDVGYTDFTWATDFRVMLPGGLTGQCPCAPASPEPPANVAVCTDESADYFVRVRRRPGSTLNCVSYTIEVSNGLYDTP